MANSDMCLEAAQKAFPNDEKMRVAYMLGFNEGYDRANEQTPLPSNLDEAAEEYEEGYGKYLYGLSTAFKAGAEWMAGQGETHEHYVIREVADHDIGPAIVCYPDTFEIGDKVVVQIRKK